MDDPRHARLRKIVSAGFTPRMLQKLEDSVQTIASGIVDDIADRGSVDFVVDVAAALPLKIVCELMGVPASQYSYVFDNTNVILGAGDPEYVPEGTDIITALLTAGGNLAALMQDIIVSKRGGDGDDLTSQLVNADLDDDELTDADLASFFILLVVAGNETTRNNISWGVHALATNPDQYALLRSDPDRYLDSAVEEVTRWASPVNYMSRTVHTPVEIHGQRLEAGEKVALMYLAANRDPAVFPDPHRFDVTRSPNPQVAFGYGPHFCLGAHLARLETRSVLAELVARVERIELAGEVEHVWSSFINGIKRLPATFTRS